MCEKETKHRKYMVERVGESETAVAFDKKCLDTDKDAFVKKSVYLHKFRDENKKVSISFCDLVFFIIIIIILMINKMDI